MLWGNPGCVAEVGAGVIPKPSSGGVVTGVSVSVWNAKRHFLERPISGNLWSPLRHLSHQLRLVLQFTLVLSETSLFPSDR